MIRILLKWENNTHGLIDATLNMWDLSIYTCNIRSVTVVTNFINKFKNLSIFKLNWQNFQVFKFLRIIKMLSVSLQYLTSKVIRHNLEVGFKRLNTILKCLMTGFFLKIKKSKFNLIQINLCINVADLWFLFMVFVIFQKIF